MESKSQLVGKADITESPAIVVKAKKPPVEEEEEAESPEEESDEETPPNKGKGKKPPWLKGKAYTWEAAKLLPEAKSLSRVELMGLVRRNISGQPRDEQLEMFEALLDDMNNELTECKVAVEELYYAQPATLEEEKEEVVSTDLEYLSEFTQAVTDALESNQPTTAKAEVIQKALGDVALALRAELEPKSAQGDMVAAYKAAISPLADQIAQLNARLGVQQQAITLPVQKSVTVPSMNTLQPQNQLPTSPITGQPSSLTALVRGSVGL